MGTQCFLQLAFYGHRLKSSHSDLQMLCYGLETFEYFA